MIRKTLRKTPKPNPPKPRSEEPQRFTMRVRSGADVSDVLLTNNSAVQGLPGDEGAWTSTGMGPSLRAKASADTRGPKPVGREWPAAVPPSRGRPPPLKVRKPKICRAAVQTGKPAVARRLKCEIERIQAMDP